MQAEAARVGGDLASDLGRLVARLVDVYLHMHGVAWLLGAHHVIPAALSASTSHDGAGGS